MLRRCVLLALVAAVSAAKIERELRFQASGFDFAQQDTKGSKGKSKGKKKGKGGGGGGGMQLG